MESIVFEKVEEKREMVKKTRKILEYNTVVLEDDTGSLKARQGKNMVWEDEEVGLIIFWKQKREQCCKSSFFILINADV